MVKRYPRNLKVLPPCKGKLEVQGPHEGGYLVHYDVETPGGAFVYDVRVLTREQIKEWTGVELD